MKRNVLSVVAIVCLLAGPIHAMPLFKSVIENGKARLVLVDQRSLVTHKELAEKKILDPRFRYNPEPVIAYRRRVNKERTMYRALDRVLEEWGEQEVAQVTPGTISESPRLREAREELLKLIENYNDADE